MIKKYARIYGEAFKLAISYPQFILLFLFSNLPTFFDFYYLSDTSNLILTPLFFVSRLAALGGIGYLVIHLLRRNEPPKDIVTKGVVRNFWIMVKYMLLQLLIVSLVSIIPLTILERYFVIPSFVPYFWMWINEYLFIFLIFEAIFWEDKGVGKAFRTRNVFMLARFEWMLAIYIVVKLPFLLVKLLPLWGYGWIYRGVWVVIPILFIMFMDWVNTIFTFKVYGEDRLRAIQEVEDKMKESSKKLKEKIREKRSQK